MSTPVTIIALGVPSLVRNVKNDGDVTDASQIGILFEAPLSNGGQTIQSYEIWDPNGLLL
jgi:hypothetical protein